MKHFQQAKAKTESVQGSVVRGYEELAPGGPPTTAGTEASGDQVAIAATEGLPNTDEPPEAGEDQLISFTRFEARDPFVQLVDDSSASGDEPQGDEAAVGDTAATDSGSASSGTDTTAATSTGSSSSGSTDTTTTVGSTDDTAATSGTTSTSVSISVNGDVLVVAVGDTFPPSDPAFKLVAIDGDLVKIGLAGGSFSNGAQTVNLKAGDSVTLISQPDGARFTIEIVEIG
jgi:hypothetical protein